MLRKIGVVPFFTNFFWCLAYGHSWNDFSQPNLWVDRSRSFFTDFLKYLSYRQFWSNLVLFVFLQKSSGSSFARFAKNSKSWYLPINGSIGSVWPLWFSIRTTLTSFTAFRHICPDFKISANHGFLAAGLLAAGFLAAGFLASWLLPSFLE